MTSGRIYEFYFQDLQEPVKIFAGSREQCKPLLRQAIAGNPDLAGRRIVHEKTSSLVTGVTTIEQDGQTFVWSGAGWQPQA